MAFAVLAALLAALLLEPLARRLRLPFAVPLVLVGFLGSELLVAAGLDTGLRWYHFHDLVLYVLLPVLVFEAALRMRIPSLLQEFPLIAALALPGTLLALLVIAAVSYYAVAHPVGFPWMAALIGGAILCATDPSAVLEGLQHRRGSRRPAMLLEGEALFNDALAIVAFGLLLGLAAMEGAALSWSDSLGLLLLTFLGGLGLGAMVGVLTWALMRWRRQSSVQGLLTVMAAFSAYLLAELLLDFSGVMAVLACGLILGEAYRRQPGADGFVGGLWSFNAYLASTVIFLLVGATVTADMFTERWLAMLIAIAAVISARLVTVFGLVPLTGLLPSVRPVPLGQQGILVWGGTRGAVTLALALSLPLDLPYWYTLQSMAYGVALFSLLVQAPSLRSLSPP